jgi:multisubunit Na+/H+ antiporter MnhE subunit
MELIVFILPYLSFHSLNLGQALLGFTVSTVLSASFKRFQNKPYRTGTSYTLILNSPSFTLSLTSKPIDVTEVVPEKVLIDILIHYFGLSSDFQNESKESQLNQVTPLSSCQVRQTSAYLENRITSQAILPEEM